MKLKKFIKPLILLVLVSMPFLVKAYSKEIIASGDTIGISINTDGVLVVGTYPLNGENTYSNLKIGDSIIKSNNKFIRNANDLMNSIDASSCTNINITYKRNNKIYNDTLYLKEEDGICKTGLYVKDKITGIGTLTYIDPKTMLFGALGHEILENSTGMIVNTNDGTIFDSEVINISKSKIGSPGEKIAKYYSSNIDGNIFENTNKGIFGTYVGKIPENSLYKVANIENIKLGPAKIKTVISGRDINEYDINILKITNDMDIKNFVFEITDEKLINLTGGIVQGMSGSPIIQGDYIIGAVTHVTVDNPIRGYGIFITNMLKEAEN